MYFDILFTILAPEFYILYKGAAMLYSHIKNAGIENEGMNAAMRIITSALYLKDVEIERPVAALFPSWRKGIKDYVEWLNKFSASFLQKNREIAEKNKKGSWFFEIWRKDKSDSDIHHNPPPPGGSSVTASEVGGVLIKFGISEKDLLSFSESSNIEIDNLTSISLKGLLSEAKKYQDKWEELPDELRYLGVDRIYGFILDGEDVLIIGQKAESENGIEIDNLIIGLNTVWKKGLIPGCSLDPSPYDISGPQYARVLGVPGNSSFAKIMLDADYQMKKLMTFGSAEYGIDDYRSCSDIIFKNYQKEDFQKKMQGRFWFFPKSLTGSNTWISPDKKSVIFNTGVQVLSEEMVLAQNGLIGTGKTYPSYYEAAEEFTEFYSRFEEKIKDKNGKYLFKELHGLFDVTALSNFLRYLEIDFNVLEEFSSLKTGKVEAPSFYPGILYQIPKTDIITSGGVEISSRIRIFGITAKNKETNQEEIDALFWKGTGFLSTGKYHNAKQIFEDILELTPEDKDASAYLAISEIGIGNFDEARINIENALKKDPDNQLLASISEQMQILFGKTENQSDLAFSNLSDQYVKQSEYLISMELYDAALKKAQLAVEANKDNGDARMAIAEIFIRKEDFYSAKKALLHAKRIYREELRKNKEDESIKYRLASALLLSSMVYLGIDIDYMNEIEYYGEINKAIANTEKAIQETEEAFELDPNFPNALITSIQCRIIKAELYDIMGYGGSYKGAVRIANILIEKHPNLDSGYAYRALLNFKTSKYKEALEDVQKAIEINPSSGIAIIVRGKLYMRDKKWEKALEYLERGVRIKGYQGGKFFDDIQECRKHIETRR